MTDTVGHVTREESRGAGDDERQTGGVEVLVLSTV